MDWTAERIRDLRAALRFTNEEFAQHLGVSVKTVRNWQADRHAPTPHLQRALDSSFAGLTDAQRDRLHVPVSAGDGPAGLDEELWGLREMLDPASRLPSPVADVERDLRWLHEVYGQAAPEELVAVVRHHLRLALRLLREPQPIRHRIRLCRVTGHLAGLRAWLAFDLRDLPAADKWFRLAIDAAQEAGDASLLGWVIGAWSVPPSYGGDPRAALARVQRAQRGPVGANAAVAAWLHALEARSLAALGRGADAQGALERARSYAHRATAHDRLHGMDYRGGNLDLSYYEGTSLVLLGHAASARQFLSESLVAQGPERRKARAIVLLEVATTHVQQGEVEESCRVAASALSLPVAQRIGPIDTRWRALRARLEPWQDHAAVRDLDEMVRA